MSKKSGYNITAWVKREINEGFRKYQYTYKDKSRAVSDWAAIDKCLTKAMRADNIVTFQLEADFTV